MEDTEVRNLMSPSPVRSLLFGVAIGDALGVPVEFCRRQSVKNNPVSGMMAFGSHNVPAGTFSDDTSLTMCLAETLTHDFNLRLIAGNFIRWYRENYWTATGEVFDIGNATLMAITRLEKGTEPELAGGADDFSNGNGSLMRIAPLVFYLRDKPVSERFSITRQVSSITHRHIRSVIACFYYLEFASGILAGKDKFAICEELKTTVTGYLVKQAIDPAEIALFDRLLKSNISEFHEDEIFSSGYVVHTLEASIWCLLNTNNYKDAVLKAVNLGDDTDTTGAVTGGLAGLLYGFENIPAEWLNTLAKKKEIEDLARRIALKYY